MTASSAAHGQHANQHRFENEGLGDATLLRTMYKLLLSTEEPDANGMHLPEDGLKVEWSSWTMCAIHVVPAVWRSPSGRCLSVTG